MRHDRQHQKEAAARAPRRRLGWAARRPRTRLVLLRRRRCTAVLRRCARLVRAGLVLARALVARCEQPLALARECGCLGLAVGCRHRQLRMGAAGRAAQAAAIPTHGSTNWAKFLWLTSEIAPGRVVCHQRTLRARCGHGLYLRLWQESLPVCVSLCTLGFVSFANSHGFATDFARAPEITHPWPSFLLHQEQCRTCLRETWPPHSPRCVWGANDGVWRLCRPR